MKDKIIKAAATKVYKVLRVSTKGQANDEKSGLDTQREIIKEYLERNSLPDGEEIVDVGKSAREHLHIKRGKLGKLLTSLGKQTFLPSSVILCFAFADRFTRAEPSCAVEEFLKITKMGVDIIFCDIDQYVRATDDETVRTNQLWPIIASFASNSLEWKRRSVRTQGAWNKFRRSWTDYIEGRGPRPTQNSLMMKFPWWHKKAGDKIVEVDLKKAKVVQKIFYLYTDKHWPLQKIAEHLNEKETPQYSNYKRRAGTDSYNEANQWSPDSVKHVLTSPSVTGEHRFTCIEIIKLKRIIKPYLLENGEQAIVPDMYEAIISKKQFLAARKLIAINKSRSGKRSVHHPLNVFSGIMKDGYYKISLHLSSIKTPKNDKNYTYYHTNRIKHTKLPQIKMTNAESFERAFFAAYLFREKFWSGSESWSMVHDTGSTPKNDIAMYEEKIERKKSASENLDDSIMHERDRKVRLRLQKLMAHNNREIERYESKLAELKNYTVKVQTEEFRTALEKMYQFTHDEGVRSNVRRFFAETNHKVYIYQSGFDWDRSFYLNKFATIQPLLGDAENWLNFNEETFYANPFLFLNEYILLKTRFGCGVPFDPALVGKRGFAMSMFKEFFGDEFKSPQTKNRNAVFICEIGENDYFAGVFRNNGKSQCDLRYIIEGPAFLSRKVTIEETGTIALRNPYSIGTTGNLIRPIVMDKFPKEEITHIQETTKAIAPDFYSFVELETSRHSDEWRDHIYSRYAWSAMVHGGLEHVSLV